MSNNPNYGQSYVYTIRDELAIDCPYRTGVSFGYMLLELDLEYEYFVYSPCIFVHFERHFSQIGWPLF